MESSSVPFSSEQELYRKLKNKSALSDSPKQAHQTYHNDFCLHKLSAEVAAGANDVASLPGYPQLSLSSPNLPHFLQSELLTPDLDKLAPRLWLVAKEDSGHISSLTHQVVRGRRIIITENPELHLVWVDDRVFLKPLPKYLLSHTFWNCFLTYGHDKSIQPSETAQLDDKRRAICRAAKGFLRSYALLIKHKSDFELATSIDHRLLPRGIKFKDFVRFSEACKDNIGDMDVCPRYQFGELRLTRLNFWSKIFLGRFTFHKIEGQYSAHFARYYGPLLFIFALLSLLLGSLQVGLAAIPILDPASSKRFSTSFPLASKGIALTTLGILAAIVLCLGLQMISLISREVVFALRHHAKWLQRDR